MRFRKAKLLLVQHSEAAAIDMLESVIASADTPPHIYAAACLDAAQALERQGARSRAIELYELTVSAFGVDPHAKSTAQRARVSRGPRDRRSCASIASHAHGAADPPSTSRHLTSKVRLDVAAGVVF